MLFAGNYTRQPAFDRMRESGRGFRIAGSLENTDHIMTDSFWLGVYPGMTEDMLEFMIEKIREFVRKYE